MTDGKIPAKPGKGFRKGTAFIPSAEEWEKLIPEVKPEEAMGAVSMTRPVKPIEEAKKSMRWRGRLIDIMFETDGKGNRDYRHITATGIVIIAIIILLLGVGFGLICYHWNSIYIFSDPPIYAVPHSY